MARQMQSQMAEMQRQMQTQMQQHIEQAMLSKAGMIRQGEVADRRLRMTNANPNPSSDNIMCQRSCI